MTQRNEKIKPSYDENRQVLGKIYPLSTPFTVILDVITVLEDRMIKVNGDMLLITN